MYVIVTMAQWMKTAWALVPDRCDLCGRPRSVAAMGADHVRWGSLCTACDHPQALGPGRSVRPDLRWMIGEVRPLVRAVQDRQGWRNIDVMIWSRPGVAIAATDLSEAITSLRMLSLARETYACKPGEWALQLRADGSLWAPWCPIEYHWDAPRSGDPLPYREATLGYTPRKRSCVTCRAEMRRGDRVWRPYNPEGTLMSAGWDADANQTACVCHDCARKVIAKGVETDGGKVFGPLRLVRSESGDAAGGRSRA